MPCECFKIGGPFIAEDPDCPEHGRNAQEREHERFDMQHQIQELTKRVEFLERMFRSNTK